MKRRSLILYTAATLVSNVSVANSRMVAPGVRRVWVDNPELVQQECPLWCWAASISMIFASQGHVVAQERIVQRTFGAVQCVGSGNTRNIAANLSQSWEDDDGNKFRSTVVAGYDALNRILAINNSVIYNELSQGRPLLCCNTHHAMALVTADFQMTPMGPNVIAAGVLDPWPTAGGFHALSNAELVPAHLGGQLTFLAAVRVR